MTDVWPEPLYLDTSALVKLFVPEAGSDALNARLSGHRAVIVSDLAVTECASALGRRVREGRLAGQVARRLHREALRLQTRVTAVEMTPPMHRRAEQLLMTLEVPIRTLDALHIAAALEADAATIVSSDDRLLAAAAATGLFTPSWR